MRGKYESGEDLSLARPVFLVTASVILKLFDGYLKIGIITANSSHFLRLGVAAILFNIALNMGGINPQIKV